MSRSNFMLDWVLPGVLIVGTGAVTLFLTGEQEDIVDNQSEQLRESQNLLEQQRLSPSGEVVESILQEVSSIKTSLSKLSDDVESLSNVTPSWATQLMNLTTNISSEISSLKETIANQNYLGIHSQSIKAAVVETKTEEFWRAQLLSALADFGGLDPEGGKQIEEPNQIELIKKASDSMSMYVGNLLKYPSIPRYRKIATGNSSFKSTVQQVPTHERLLRAIGFEKKPTGYEWLWSLPKANEIENQSDYIQPTEKIDFNGGTLEVPNRFLALKLLKECIEVLQYLQKDRDTFLLKVASISSKQSLDCEPPTSIIKLSTTLKDRTMVGDQDILTRESIDKIIDSKSETGIELDKRKDNILIECADSEGEIIEFPASIISPMNYQNIFEDVKSLVKDSKG